MGRQTTRSSRVFWRFFRVPALLRDSSRPLCSFFVPSSNYDLAGALHGFLAALGATLGAGNATDHRPSLHRSPIQTRRNPAHHSSNVQQMAYDLLAIPAMSSEVERAFSGAKNTLDDKRTKLGSAVFEATELEKHWMKAGLGDDLRPSGHLSGYLTSDGKEVRPEALWGNVGRPEDLDSDVEPE